MSQARPRRGAHAAPRTAALALPALSTVRPRHGRLIPKPLSALMIGATGGGLALLSAIGPATPTTSTPPAALVANAAVPSAPLGGEQRDERASRSRRAAEPDPEPVPAEAEAVAVPGKQPAAPLMPGCDAAEHHVDRYANGRLPDSVLCELPGGSDERLRSDAALAFVRLAAAYEAGLEEPICLTDGYRTLAEQQQLRRIKPRYAARPGSSEHGWGLAVDLSCGVQSFRSKEHAWMVANAGNYGWFLPDWAKRGGARPEPWHWEFSGT